MQHDPPSNLPPSGWYQPPPPPTGRAPAQGDPRQPGPDQPPASGAPPPRRRRGLVVALAALAGVGLLGLLALGTLLRIGEDLRRSSTPGTAPAATASAATAPAISGPAITGDRYAFGIPQGWSDASAEYRRQFGATAPPGAELLHGVRPGSAPPGRAGASITMMRGRCPCDIDEEAEGVLRGAGQAGVVTGASDPRHTALGGEGALTFDYTHERQGVALRSWIHLSIHDGFLYMVKLDTLETMAADTEGAYRHVVETWRWR
jgi:hypothetical protein